MSVRLADTWRPVLAGLAPGVAWTDSSVVSPTPTLGGALQAHGPKQLEFADSTRAAVRVCKIRKDADRCRRSVRSDRLRIGSDGSGQIIAAIADDAGDVAPVVVARNQARVVPVLREG